MPKIKAHHNGQNGGIARAKDSGVKESNGANRGKLDTSKFSTVLALQNFRSIEGVKH